MEKIIYLDNAATTKPFDEMSKIYQDCMVDFFNPSSVYDPAISIRKKIELARKSICEALHGEHGSVIFTSGATEADNLALSCFKPRQGISLAVFAGEHPAVFNKAKAFENAGAKVIYLPVGKNGTLDKVEDFVDSSVAFVSVMHVSNETGAINDIANICKSIKKISPKAIVHVDGVQAVGKIPVNLRALGVDMYTISAHKIHGPKGIGALWVKNGINVSPAVFGGGQEKGFRSGTENVAGILSLEYAIKKVTAELNRNSSIVSEYRSSLIDSLRNEGLSFDVNGEGSPYILNLTFENIRGEVLLHTLEKHKIYVSTGSACSSKKPENRMLKGMGKTDSQIQGTIRISFSAYDKLDISEIATTIANEVKILQSKIKRK